jgi:WD40 repeat protein
LEQIDLGEGVHVNSIAWSPDGSKLAYGNADGSVTLFDATQLPGYAPMATATAESP